MINICIWVEVITTICLLPTMVVYCCLLFSNMLMNNQIWNKYSKYRLIISFLGVAELGIMITLCCISMENR